MATAAPRYLSGSGAHARNCETSPNEFSELCDDVGEGATPGPASEGVTPHNVDSATASPRYLSGCGAHGHDSETSPNTFSELRDNTGTVTMLSALSKRRCHSGNVDTATASPRYLSGGGAHARNSTSSPNDSASSAIMLAKVPSQAQQAKESHTRNVYTATAAPRYLSGSGAQRYRDSAAKHGGIIWALKN
jgi:hypothetical protein